MSTRTKTNGNSLHNHTSDSSEKSNLNIKIINNQIYLADELQIPGVNIYESDQEYILELAVPGFGKEELKIMIIDNILTVSSERKDNTEANILFSQAEYIYNSFVRSFRLPENILEDDITAIYHKGLLIITIPKCDNEEDEDSGLL